MTGSIHGVPSAQAVGAVVAEPQCPAVGGLLFRCHCTTLREGSQERERTLVGCASPSCRWLAAEGEWNPLPGSGEAGWAHDISTRKPPSRYASPFDGLVYWVSTLPK